MSSTNEQQITQMDLDKPLENPIRKKTHTCSRTIIIITAITIILTMIICAGIGIINYPYTSTYNHSKYNCYCCNYYYSTRTGVCFFPNRIF